MSPFSHQMSWGLWPGSNSSQYTTVRWQPSFITMMSLPTHTSCDLCLTSIPTPWHSLQCSIHNPYCYSPTPHHTLHFPTQIISLYSHSTTSLYDQLLLVTLYSHSTTFSLLLLYTPLSQCSHSMTHSQLLHTLPWVSVHTPWLTPYFSIHITLEFSLHNMLSTSIQLP